MKRNKIINQGIIALIMATIMFIISVPTSTWKAVADGIKENITESSQEASIDTEKDLESNDLIDVSASGDVYIVDENKSNRTIDSKEFIMSDGSIIEQKFLENIHYFDNGEYKEIDNSLIEKKDETGKAVSKQEHIILKRTTAATI